MTINQLNTLTNQTFNELKNKHYNNIVIEAESDSKKKSYRPAQMVILSLAFNMAFENYKKIRPAKPSIMDVSDMMIRFFNNKYTNPIGDDEAVAKASNSKADQRAIGLIDNQQNYRYEMLEKFHVIEPILFRTIERLRNYHAHYIHEPGVLTFTDLFVSDESSLSQQQFEMSKEWFSIRFKNVKTHLLKSLGEEKIRIEKDTKKNSLRPKEERLNEIVSTIQHIDGLFFTKEDKLTLNAQLFMASMFLTRRQSKLILRNWNDIGRLSGYAQSLTTFYTYYCLKESYSINNYNDDLLKFRNICSRLSHIPLIENKKLDLVYGKIRELNKVAYEKVYELNEKIKKIKENEPPLSKDGNEIAKKMRESWEENLLKRQDQKRTAALKIIPVRKKEIATEVYLQFLLDNNILDNDPKKNYNIKVALKKTQTDRLEYYDKYQEISKEESFTAIKNRAKTKSKDDPSKKDYLSHLKELKRNFVFRTADEIKLLTSINDSNKNQVPKGYRFCIKKKNALLQVTFDKNNNSDEQVINVRLSPDFLLKWVYLILQGKGDNVLTDMIKYVEAQCKYRSTSNSKDILSKLDADGRVKNIHISKLIPRSVVDVSHNRKLKPVKERVKELLSVRIDNLLDFNRRNFIHPKPWQYASYEKINIIMKYMHCMLLEDVYINDSTGCDEDEKKINFVRHKAFSVEDYDIARQYFRFFGRYKRNTLASLDEEYVQPSVVKKLMKNYDTLFSYINDSIDSSSSLEELFNAIIHKQIAYYQKYLDNLDKYDDKVFHYLFKVDAKRDEEAVNESLNKMFSKSIDVSPEVISVKNYLENSDDDTDSIEFDNLTNLKKLSSTADGNKSTFDIKKVKNNFLDYRYIRKKLEGPKTNSDYIIQYILPQICDSESYRKNYVFKFLLKNKTQELVLWNIAKYYRRKSQNLEKVTEQNDKHQIHETIDENRDVPYQDFCTFNRAYRQDIQYQFVIDEKFLKANRKKQFLDNVCLEEGETLKFNINIPARRYDNKFIMYETTLIKEYMLFNHYKDGAIKQKTNYQNEKGPKGNYDLTQYDDIMHLIHYELEKSIGFISEVLKAEKKVIESNRTDYKNLIKEKYESEQIIKDFYISLTDKFEDRNQNVIHDRMLYEKFLERGNRVCKGKTFETFKKYLVFFRNFALHYQLQDPEKSKVVNEVLNKLNGSNKRKGNHNNHRSKRHSKKK